MSGDGTVSPVGATREVLHDDCSCAEQDSVVRLIEMGTTKGAGMGELRVRNIDDGVVAEWRARARRHGRSVAEEVRDLLTEEAMRPRRETVARLRQLQEQILAESGVLPDSTVGIREERDRRG